MSITYHAEAHPEETPVVGNAMAGGDETVDREAEQWVLAQLDRGNEWAWCSVRVVATLELGGVTFTGHTWLGCCSYKSAADFQDPDGYYPQMCEEALDDLKATLRTAIARGLDAAKALAELGGE